MKNRLPRPREMAVLLALAVLCSCLVGMTKRYDVGLAFMGAPLFLVAALMGLRRSMELEAEMAPASDESPADENDANS